MTDRYQHQRWYVKAYRWLRWRPLYAVLALRAMARSKEDRAFMWRIYAGLADVKMKHYYTLEEARERIDERLSNKTTD